MDKPSTRPTSYTVRVELETPEQNRFGYQTALSIDQVERGYISRDDWIRDTMERAAESIINRINAEEPTQ